MKLARIRNEDSMVSQELGDRGPVDAVESTTTISQRTRSKRQIMMIQKHCSTTLCTKQRKLSRDKQKLDLGLRNAGQQVTELDNDLVIEKDTKTIERTTRKRRRKIEDQTQIDRDTGSIRSEQETTTEGIPILVETTVKRKRRTPAGVSTAIFPPTTAQYFGLLQEKLWQEPFWLLIGVTFLNKTAGRAAAPVFWRIKALYPTPYDLSQAKETDLYDIVHHLGLQTQRSRRLIRMAKAWVDTEPTPGKLYRTLHYPNKGDGKKHEDEAVQNDQICAGALEIGHIPGCGPYAFDSWRIFCRDVFRGVADDYNGLNAGPGFEPEWKRVLPLDKELRVCLQWMWLREGFIWDFNTGKKRMAEDGTALVITKSVVETIKTTDSG